MKRSGALVVFLSGLSALVWGFLAWRIAAIKRDPLHVGVIFCLLFALTYPIKSIATEYNFAVINVSQLDLHLRLLGLGLANVAGLAFLTPILWIGRKNPEGVGHRGSTQPSSDQIGWGWLVAFFLFIILSFGPSSVVKIFSFEALTELADARGQERVGSSLSSLLGDAGLVCLMMFVRSVVIVFSSLNPVSRIGLGLFGLSIIYVLLALTQSKYMALLPIALFILFMNMNRVRADRYWKFYRVVLMGALGVVALGIVGYIRGFGSIVDEQDSGVMFQVFIQVINAFDAPDNFVLILSRMDDLWLGDLSFAPTLHYTFLAAIPRFFWSSKPLIMGNLFIMEKYIPERFSDHTGEVVSPSMPGEMILSGGVVFMILWSFVLGLLYAFSYRYAHRGNPSTLSVLAYSWLTLNVFNLLRSGTGIVSPFVVFLLIAFTVLLFWKFMQITVAPGFGRVPMDPHSNEAS